MSDITKHYTLSKVSHKVFHAEYQTACDLYAIYQREHTISTLQKNIDPDPFKNFALSQRIEARNKVLGRKLMAAMATRPDLFDISRYRQPPGRLEKKAYSHPVNLYPDWQYFTTMIDRPFLNELHALWNTQPLYAWSESEEERQERMAYRERMAKYKKRKSNVSMTESCSIM